MKIDLPRRQGDSDSKSKVRDPCLRSGRSYNVVHRATRAAGLRVCCDLVLSDVYWCKAKQWHPLHARNLELSEAPAQ